jgi:hypothetical protein
MTSISGYSKNDFFYVAAQSGNFMPTDTKCKEMNIASTTSWDVSCNEINFNDNRDRCIQKELCFNKTYATNIIAFENGHAGKDEKYLDTKMKYGNTFKTTVTLAIGIVALGYVIYKNRVISTIKV